MISIEPQSNQLLKPLVENRRDAGISTTVNSKDDVSRPLITIIEKLGGSWLTLVLLRHFPKINYNPPICTVLR
jgi:hypothetical protein